MARTAIISPNPASRVWRGRFVRRWRSIRAPRARCHRPRVSSAADPRGTAPKKSARRDERSSRSSFTVENAMPVYSVHAPVTNGADLTATDRFTFVRDGFHFWAAALTVIWLAWNRLWLALIGWIVLMVAIQFGLAKL